VSDIRETIHQQIRIIAAQHKKPLAALKDDLPLASSGLDSLCLAILVAALDDELDIDPFSGKGLMTFPVTLGDFIGLYEHEAA
jgi:hypothetical protein